MTLALPDGQLDVAQLSGSIGVNARKSGYHVLVAWPKEFLNYCLLGLCTTQK